MRRSSRRAFRRRACLSSWSIRPRFGLLPRRSANRAKTDPIDAAVIAHFVEAAKPDIRPMPDEQTPASGRSLSLGARPDRPDDRRRAPAPKAPDRKAPAEKHRPALLAALQKELSSLRDRHRRGGARLAGLAGERGPARLRARRRADHRPHPDRRIARTRPPRPAQNRRPRRPRPLDAPVRTVERQKLHRRREDASARRPSSWALWSPPATIPRSGASISASSTPENQSWSQSSPSPESSSPSSTLSSASKSHGSQLDSKDSRSPLVGEDRGGGSGRPTRRASNGAFDNLLGPRDPPPLPAPTRGGGGANAIDSTQMQ